MKTPYIINYMEEVPLQSSASLFYDNKTQINYLDKDFKIKAISFNYGPQTTTLTETSENTDTDAIYLGPDSTEKTAIIENSDLEQHSLAGPETTQFTKSNEATDTDYFFNIIDKTTHATTNKSLYVNSFIIGPDTTIKTFTVESEDENENFTFLGPETTRETRTTENSDTH